MENTERQVLQDRIGEYLYPHTEDFFFDELSDAYLEKAGIKDILGGVPVPLRKSKMGQGMSTMMIAENMAFIIGCDLNFKYRDEYIAYIHRVFTKEFVKPLINEGVEWASKNDFDFACVYFRGALLIDPDSADALYCYGRACKDSYEVGEGEEFIGRYKAESLEAFEKLTLIKPDFDMGFYFLGYAYLNMGLYVKAKLTWDTFLELSKNQEQIDEVKEWMVKLEEPVHIEEGYNLIISGRFAEGIAVLEKYEDDERFNTWWPLWYYLGVAYKELGETDMAEERLLKVLQYSPSNIEAMEELIEIYKASGNVEKVEKYQNKVQLVQHNQELDKAERTELS